MTVPLLWDEAVGRLRSKVSPQNYDMWLRPIELLSFDGGTLRLRAPNSYVRLWFESNFLSTLLKEIQELGHDVRVEFDADGPDERPPPPVAEATPEPALEVSLGSSIIASGLVRRPVAANDPLAPIRRMSQAEKVAFFS